MTKISDLFVIVAGTASLCTAYVMHSSTATNHQTESKQGRIANGPYSEAKAAQAVAAEGMRADLLRSATPVEHTGDPTAPVVVVTIPRRSDSSSNTSTIATGPGLSDRASLAGKLQRELRRVGCYDGQLNDDWTLATRTAMKTFTNRINAILPIDKPDQVLLALVQGYRGRVCNVPCPPGESLAKDGRCLSNVVLARATKSPPQNSATSAMAEPPRDLVTSVSSTVTPMDPTIRDLANDPMVGAEPSAEHPARTAAGKMSRGRATAMHRSSRRRSNFAGGFFGLFSW
jgi:hypothetical protein